jgi:hypothetical protein
MNIHKMVLAAAAGALLTGCSSLVSLNEIGPEKQAIADSRLEGIWTDEEGKETYIVKLNGTRYSIVFVDNSDSPLKLDGRVFRLGDSMLLDLYARDEAPFQLRTHSVARIWLEGDTLRIAFLDSKWLKKRAAAELVSQAVGDRTVITDSTDAVWAFLGRHAGKPEAFEEPGVLRRVR